MPDRLHRQPLHAAAACWPGTGARGALVLPLPAVATVPLPPALDLGGRRFERKAEFHLTLLAAREWRQARMALGEAAVRALFEALDWRLEGDGRYFRVQRGPAETIILDLHAPAAAAFRRGLAAAGVALPAATPHLTLFWHGDPVGIGISGPQQWRQRVRERLAIDWPAARAAPAE